MNISLALITNYSIYVCQEQHCLPLPLGHLVIIQLHLCAAKATICP